MKKNIMKKLTAILLCLTMLIPFISVRVFAEEETEASSEASAEDSESATSSDASGEEDIWKTTLCPAYMSTSFKSIDDRIIGNDVLEQMECRLIKNGYALYVDAITGEVVLLQLAEPNEDGEYEKSENGIYKYVGYFSTNPYNIGSSQSTTGSPTSDSIKEVLYSQVIVKYTENDKDQEFNSFSDAAKNDQIKVKDIRNGIRVEYTLGREQVKYLVPRHIKMEKLDALKEQIANTSPKERDLQTVNAFYSIKDPNDTTKAKKSIVEMKAKFPICEKFPIYVCEPHITPRELLRLESIIRQYTDYSFDQLDIDHAETEYTSSDKVPPLFKMALEYTVDELGLSVRCSAGNIRFDSSNYKLSNVTLLPYAGAGNVNNSGYIFTPDGSGALVKFEDIKGDAFKTTNSLYGQDFAFHEISGKNMETMRLPVFGVVEIVKDQYSTEEEVKEIDPETGEETTSIEKVMHDLKIGYLAVIESGDSLAKITVNNGGTTHMFSSVYTSFNPRPKDSYVLEGSVYAGTDAMWTVESKRKYTGDYRLRYFIMTDDISYSEMANLYRDYLINKGALTKLEEDNKDIPLYIETLGSIEVRKHFLGIPYDSKAALTSFDKTIKMLEKFRDEANINNIKLKLTGWANEGIISLVPNGVEIEDVLGGEEGFKDLIEYAKQNNVEIFPDFDFAYASRDKSFDGFDFQDDCTKTIDDRSAFRQAYDAIFQTYSYTGQAVLSPNVMSRFYNNTFEDYKNYNVGGISVSTLGDSLSSDFNSDYTLHREDSKALITKLLDKINQDNGKVMVSGGNSYVLPYVTDILDVPLDDSRYKYSSATIPFMGMVLHGYKEYAGTAINLAGDYQYALLKTIENGASPYFVIAIDNTAELKYYFNISKYYSVRYDIWLQDIVNTYNELNNALSDLMYTSIASHEFLDKSNKVVKVTYENGTSFYINYLLKDYTVIDGAKTYVIPAENFIKVDSSGNEIKIN